MFALQPGPPSELLTLDVELTVRFKPVDGEVGRWCLPDVVVVESCKNVSPVFCAAAAERERVCLGVREYRPASLAAIRTGHSWYMGLSQELVIIWAKKDDRSCCCCFWSGVRGSTSPTIVNGWLNLGRQLQERILWNICEKVYSQISSWIVWRDKSGSIRSKRSKIKYFSI